MNTSHAKGAYEDGHTSDAQMSAQQHCRLKSELSMISRIRYLFVF